MMKFEVLSEVYLPQLIKFECTNKDWFEQFIEARGENFYNRNAIEKHLIDNIKKYYSGSAYPAVVVNGVHIMARVNLKNICLQSKTAEIGYRVAEVYSDQGVASFGLKEMIRVSKELLNLECIKGYVLENNPASARVLEKQGFIPVKTMSNYLGYALSCVEYQLNIS